LADRPETMSAKRIPASFILWQFQRCFQCLVELLHQCSR
jgi:hypothetical protein